MAREITILDVTPNDVNDNIARIAFWFYPPAANQVPNPGASSQWRGASATDNANIQSGAIIEEVRVITFLQNMSLTEIKAYLLTAYNNRAAQLTAKVNPNQFYGANFDGNVWTGI
jgi:hypothetical protein